MLHLWNSLTRQLEEFKPLNDEEVGMYACGPTVYSSPTIANFRTFINEDLLKRTLKMLGYNVKHVMNITDVGHLVGDGDQGEDKVEREAVKQGKTAWDVAREYEGQFLIDMERLNIEKPSLMPRATEHIEDQIQLISVLEKKGFTYRTSDGVYFDTSKFEKYGALSRQKLDEKEAGARVEINTEKKNQSDFALWKFSPEEQKRQMEWDSPWGIGFPGWHIECSAMAVKYLGQPFDIHCGGIDLLPVHHENEIAQSEAAYEKPLANYWVHNEFLLVDGRRMGKSEGNAYTLQDVDAKGFDVLAYRYFCLGAHYRSKLNFTWEALHGAEQALQHLRKEVLRLKQITHGIMEERESTLATFVSVLSGDINIPKALATLWRMIEEKESIITPSQKLGTILRMDEVFGLRLSEVDLSELVDAPTEARGLQDERDDARARKDWKTADRIRDELKRLGWNVEDHTDGTSSLTPG